MRPKIDKQLINVSSLNIVQSWRIRGLDREMDIDDSNCLVLHMVARLKFVKGFSRISVVDLT